MNQRNRQQQAPQRVIVVQQKAPSHGCLVTALVYLLFGWIGLLVMGTWKLARWTVRASVAPLRWTWQASVTGARWSWRGATALTTRYGWRGWAVVGAVVVVLAILSAVTKALGH